jgi:hypothetical protein
MRKSKQKDIAFKTEYIEGATKGQDHKLWTILSGLYIVNSSQIYGSGKV